MHGNELVCTRARETHAHAQDFYDHKFKFCKLHFAKYKKNTLLYKNIWSIQKKVVSLHIELKIIQMSV